MGRERREAGGRGEEKGLVMTVFLLHVFVILEYQYILIISVID